MPPNEAYYYAAYAAAAAVYLLYGISLSVRRRGLRARSGIR